MKGDSSLERLLSILANDSVIVSLVRKKSGKQEPDVNKSIQDLIQIIAQYEILLIFDNADNVYVKNTVVFKTFVESILKETGKIKILITLFSRVESL